jgi:hypothetical protein
MKHPSHSASVKSPINQSENRTRLWKSTFGKSLPRAGVAGAMVSAVMALLSSLAAAQDRSTPTARHIIPLSGPWQFTTGSMDSRPSNFDQEVTVPGFHPGGQALWYRRMVTIEGSLPDVVRLEVKKTCWGVKVWVNGSEAGESWSIRTASFTDISKFVKGNGFENEIMLRVCGSTNLVPPEIPWFNTIMFLEEPDFKVDKKNGLYDSVNVILCDAPYVVRAQAAPNVQNNSVKLAVTLRNISSATKSALLKVKIVEDKSGETVAKAEQAHQAGVGVTGRPARHGANVPRCRRQ